MAVDRIGDGLALRAKGDIVSHDGTGNIAVSVGTNGQVLTSITSTASGLGWSNYTAPVKDFEGIAYSTLTASTDSITLSNIPTTYGSLVIYIMTNGTTNSANSVDGGAIYVQVNGSTTTGTYGPGVYRGQSSLYSGLTTEIGGIALAGLSASYIGLIPFVNGNDSSTTIGRNFAGYEIEITDYSDTTNFKTLRSTGGSDSGIPSTSYGGYYHGSFAYSTAYALRTTSAITSIKFYIPTVGKSFNVGTWIALFGVRK